MGRQIFAIIITVNKRQDYERGLLIFVLLIVVGSVSLHAQQQRRELSNKLIDQFYRSSSDTVITLKSEDPFLAYEGKIIRKITFEHYGLERNLYDTTRKKVINDIVRFGNKLHTNTRNSIIRNLLFVKEGRPLVAHRVADNERYLRDQDFILDARIIPKRVPGNRDAVDLVVITRDVFSMGAGGGLNSANSAEFGLYSVNVDGRAQRVQFNGLLDTDRDPKFGYQLLYSKKSIEGSFVDATISYTQINNGRSIGLENESAVFLRLDRPLVSPYARLAGGLELSRNWSLNVFDKLTEEFREYVYEVKDAWVGYNIGIKQYGTNRARHFIAMRAFDQHFTQKPSQSIEQMNHVYNDMRYFLGSITFFKQNFYKTRYIYGYGRTEDVPYGAQVSIQAGMVEQLGLKRPYIGAELDKTIVRSNGDFHHYTVRSGGFKRGGTVEDITLLAEASLFSRPISLKRFIIRQSIRLGYTRIINRSISSPLQINNEFGLNGFEADSLFGIKRLALGAETVVFTPWKLLGFHFATFAFADAAFIAATDAPLLDQPYFSLGGGIRTRNENLVFGTIELRFHYFPRLVQDLSQFKLTLSSNLRVKYTSQFVKSPALIRYN